MIRDLKSWTAMKMRWETALFWIHTLVQGILVAFGAMSYILMGMMLDVLEMDGVRCMNMEMILIRTVWIIEIKGEGRTRMRLGKRKMHYISRRWRGLHGRMQRARPM